MEAWYTFDQEEFLPSLFATIDAVCRCVVCIQVQTLAWIRGTPTIGAALQRCKSTETMLKIFVVMGTVDCLRLRSDRAL